ncbi:hypothetical protein ACFL43_01510 [Thermodesulfobacteriota bacterium]
MKKLLVLLCVMAFVFCVCGCSGAAKEEPGAKKVPARKEMPARAGEEAVPAEEAIEEAVPAEEAIEDEGDSVIEEQE